MLARFATQTPLRFFTSSVLLSSLRPQYRAMSTFKLDPAIFNSTLYKHIPEVWFPGMDLKGQGLDANVMRRWFQGTPEERLHFDGICRDAFEHALEAIGPEKFPEASAQPFLDEIENIAKKDQGGKGEDAAWTALSLTLLLDQMPRNIYRTDEGLRKVYTHYDRISFQLTSTLLSSSSPIPRPDTHPLFQQSAAHRLWFYMPLMHSEDISAHNLVDDILEKYGNEIEALEGHEGSKMFLEGQLKAEKMHREILDRFGRYPHRNGALGRKSTEEEEKFLDEGGATFGVGQTKKSTT
ncbi:hypothetical protein BKA66DRAFT_478659 [Pyrenochaeta sp. MPI-SDFR-AT-0127]|nr:hypothetical protein BKA66DRAFT_478659 [Pyrenochaeta sp. MPI-SDFR-AT-0127]